MGGADPISGIAAAVSDLALLLTKAIPSDEQRMLVLKQRSPLIYARIRKRWYNQMFRHLRNRWHEDIDSWVDLTGGGFMPDERVYAKRLLHADLKR